jgi:arylsulfatase A-like enzyme
VNPINRREFISMASAAAAGFMLPDLALAGNSGSNRPPNIVFILTDDLGYCDTNLYECRDVKTPNIHSIAENGVSFTDGYVTASLCSPSRAGLMTGRYQNRFGFEHNAGGPLRAHKEHLGLPVSELTIADHMKKADYATSCIGKWHLGSQPEFYPTRRGFDEFFGFLPGAKLFIDPSLPGVINEPGFKFHAGAMFYKLLEFWQEEMSMMRGETLVEEPEYLTDAFTREALDFIERKKNDPFFLYLSYNAPHTPLQTTQKYYDRFPHIKDEKKRIYAAMVSAVDDGVGKVLQKLKDTGIEEDTLVIFLSDNGCSLFTNACSKDPLREGKIWQLEGGLRVPFALQYPGKIPAGQTYQHPVSSLDILPTAVNLAGGSLPGNIKFDGVDLIPYLTAQTHTAPHKRLFSRKGQISTVRQGKWKLFRSEDNNWLFNLDEDVGEQKNLADKHPDKVKELIRHLKTWESEMVPPLWEPKKEREATLDDVPITICI